MSCSHYGIPLAPLVANQSHIRAGLVYISNPVDGLETGGHFSLKTICPPGFVREDGQIHPNILFGNCRLLKKIHPFSELITPTVHNIVYCYGQWQKDFKKYDNKVNFHEGLIPREQIFPINSQESSTQHTLLIIDDLLGKEDTSLVRDIFIKGSHHNNISVIFVTQNLFLPHKDYRT